jgi:hypothetical protein
VVGQGGTDALYGRPRVVETPLVERRLAAPHEVVGDLREAVARDAVVGLVLQHACVQRPRAVLLGLDQHARVVGELRHA